MKLLAQTILIVEDNDDDFESTYDAFHEQENFRNPIVRARTGAEALAYLYNEPPFEDTQAYPLPGLMLLDLNLPGIDGKKVLERVRSEPTTHKIPVIVFTTSNDPIDIEKCYAMGANSYIQKPASLSGLIESIRMIKEYWFEISLLPKIK